jgi:hypothetical protein
MAEEIINIATLTIDKTEANKSIVDTKQQIFELQKANSELRKDILKNGDATGEQTKQFVENDKALKKLNAQYRAQSEAINDLTLAELKESAALKENAKSVGQANAQNKELLKTRNQLDASTADGAAGIALINKKLEENRQFINANTSALERQRDNIGNYPSDLGKVEGALDKVGGAFGETSRTIIGFGRDVSDVADSIVNFVSGQTQATRTQIGFRSATVEATTATEVQTVATESQTVATEAGTVATAASSAGLKLLRLAIIGTGIGALVVGILAVKEAFTSSQEGQERYAKIMSVLGSITGNLSDLLAKLGRKLIDIFENPKKALSDFGELLKRNIINRFVGLAELIPNIGKAIKFLLAGEFSKAGVVMVNSVSKITTGVDDLTGKIGQAAKAVSDLAKDAAADAKSAAKVADMRAKADRLEIQLITEKSAAEAKAAELRLKSRDVEAFNATQRLKFAKQAADAAGVVEAKEQEVLSLRYKAIKLENTLSDTTIENRRAEAEALAALAEWRRAEADDTRAELKEQKKIRGEIAAERSEELKARQDASAALLVQAKAAIAEEVAANKKGFEDNKKLSEEKKNEELADAEFLKSLQIKRIEESKLLEADKAAALVEIQKGYLAEVEVINTNFEISEKERKLREAEEAKVLADTAFQIRLLQLEEQGMAELEVQNLQNGLKLEEAKRLIDERAKLEGTLAKTVTELKLLEDKKYSVATKKLNDQVAAAKRATNLGMVKDSLAAASAIFGENKAVAVAMALVNTYEGISAGVALGYPAAIPAVAAAAATGFAAVKNILKTDKGATGGGSSSSAGSTVTTPAAVFENPARTQTVATVDAPPVQDTPNTVQPVLVVADLDEVQKNQLIKIKSS